MNRKLSMSMVLMILLLLSVVVFGCGFSESNVVNSMFYQSLGVIGFLVVLQLKRK